ncbi:MAG TPA: N-acetyl-gamma-glutamyl-phosphate reductase, partial [Candidatus Limnocylindrales bacterium]
MTAVHPGHVSGTTAIPGEGSGTAIGAGAPASARTGGSPETEVDGLSGPPRVRVAIVGATGYVGAELIRLLDRHPRVEIVGLVGRGREDEPIGRSHAHLATTGHTVNEQIPPADVVFLALPHSAAAALVPELLERGMRVFDLGADYRLHDPADYPRWYGFEHPRPDLLGQAVYGLPELHRADLRALAGQPTSIVGSPGCYPTATLLALAPLAREGLIADLVVDAKSGVSGAGREPKLEYLFGEINESVRAYGLGGHRHVAEIEQELAALEPTGSTATGSTAAGSTAA